MVTPGIGLETTRALADAGAHVLVPARRRARAEDAVAGMDGVDVDELDLADLASVHGFADRFLATGRSIDILINNAGDHGVAARHASGPGWEGSVRDEPPRAATRWRTGCAPALTRDGARVVRGVTSARAPVQRTSAGRTCSSSADPYDKWQAYGQAKTANSPVRRCSSHVGRARTRAGARSRCTRAAS